MIRKYNQIKNLLLEYFKSKDQQFTPSRWHEFFNKNQLKIFYASLIITTVLGIFLFDFRISEGTDDSGYIMSACNFLKGKAFPSFHGAFYPIFLSFFIHIFGIKLFILKLISFILIVGHFVLLFITFRKKIPASILMPVILLVAINSYLLYFASSTFSEPLYLFIQSLVIYIFFILIEKMEDQSKPLFSYWKLWLAFGLSCFLLSITRNIGLGVFISLIIYFVINRQVKPIVYSFAAFLLFQVPFTIYKNIYWKSYQLGIENQFSAFLNKDPYYPHLGKENFSGIVHRFIQNSEYYLSHHFLEMIGLKSAAVIKTNIFLTIIISLLFFLSFVYFIRNRNKYLLFTSLYVLVGLAATFITVQVLWNQSRLIIIYMPLMLILFSYYVYKIGENKKFRILKLFLLILFLASFFLSSVTTIFKARYNYPLLVKNIQGESFYGYTPDLVNYFKLSKWTADHLPKDAVIACRKPSMAFIFGNGRDFYGIYSFPKLNTDSALLKLTGNKGLIIIDLKELYKMKITPLPEIFNQYIKTLFFSDNHDFVVYDPPAEEQDHIKMFLKSNHIPYNSDIQLFEQYIKNSNEAFFAEDPDLLLNELKNHQVKYLILASFRLDLSQKTNKIVNTLHRYARVISIKYPHCFKPVYQIGTNDNEPAILLEVKY